MARIRFIAFIIGLSLFVLCFRTNAAELLRVEAGLQVLYDFSGSEGSRVRDVAVAGEAIDLSAADTKALQRVDGGVEITAKTLIRSRKAAKRLSSAIQLTGEATVEAWLKPARLDQTGPARIVTLSKDTSERNFTLGQDGDRYDVRFRTTQTSVSGTPSLSAKPGSITTNRTHVVYTRDRSGRTRIYIDGKLNVEQTIAGSTSNWSGDFRLGLANELSNDRPWLGTFYLVAIYNRDLLPHEVEQNFKAGPDATKNQTAKGETQSKQRLFETEIAPLLAQRCLECHDGATSKGKLDLSTKAAAFAGGKNGKAIVPGKASESLLWKNVESDEMPEDRPALSAREKAILKEWIEAGAPWTMERIEPTMFAKEKKPVKNWLRRLTVPEYIETVRATVSVDIGKEAREILPKDLRADGFYNTAYNLGVDLAHVEAYGKLAEIIVRRIDVDSFVGEFAKSKDLKPESLRKTIQAMGKWMLRGPLEEQELTAFLSVAEHIKDKGGDFKEVYSYVLESMLQAPRFIYRVENQNGDGKLWPVGDYELASRLSYIVWGASPDKELMRAVEAGELYDRRNVGRQVSRMLKDPRAVERTKQFVCEWLDLDRLDNLRPNVKRFPNWDANLAADMREETLAFAEEVLWKQKRPLSELLTAKMTYATPRLAKHYGLKPSGDGLQRYDLSSENARGGLLTHGSVLTVGGDDASMVARGLFLLHDFLRGKVSDPPPCVDTTPVPTKPGLTQRKIAEARVANISCGGCHSRFEPLAFGLERFDGIGLYRTKDEHGNELREDGEIFFPGKNKPVTYKTSAEMMKTLSESDRVRESLTWKVAQFALGRPLVASDAAILKTIHEKAMKKGGTYASVITALVMSDLVQTTETDFIQ